MFSSNQAKLITIIRNLLKHKKKIVLAGSILFLTILFVKGIFQFVLAKSGINASSYTTEVPKDIPTLFLTGGGQPNTTPTPSNKSGSVAGVSTESQIKPSATPLSAKASPTSTPKPTPTPTPISTPTPTPTPTETPSPTLSPTPEPTSTPTPTPEPTPSSSPSDTLEPTPSPSAT